MSQPSNSASSRPKSNATATFVPASGWSTTSSVAAASGSTTAGSGSTSTHTASAASTPWAGCSLSTTATGSPTNRTRPVARRGRSIAWLSMGTGGPSGATSMSAPVTTAATPGMRRASSTSTPSSTPWATVDRTKVACSAPSSNGSRRSAQYVPPTVRNRGSSTRVTRLPKMLVPPVPLLMGAGAYGSPAGATAPGPRRLLVTACKARKGQASGTGMRGGGAGRRA